MNRGFNAYYKDARSKTKKTFRGKGNFLRYWLYLIVSTIGKLFVLPEVIFSLADVRVAREAGLEQKITVSKAIGASNTFVSIWTMFLARFLQLLMFLGGIIIISVVGVGLYYLGYIITLLLPELSSVELLPVLDDMGLSSFAAIFMLPAIVAVVVWIVLAFFYSLPSAYICDSIPGIGASEVVFGSINGMKMEGKATVFAIALVTSLRLLLFTLIEAAILAVFSVLFVNILELEYEQQLGFMLLAYLLVALIAVWRLPRIVLPAQIAFVSLMQDMATGTFGPEHTVVGVHVKHVKEKRVNKLSDKNIRDLFDKLKDVEPERPYIPVKEEMKAEEMPKTDPPKEEIVAETVEKKVEEPTENTVKNEEVTANKEEQE